jgi:hypothetical protein
LRFFAPLRFAQNDKRVFQKLGSSRKMRFSVWRNVKESARIGSMLNSVFKTSMLRGSTANNQRAKSVGYFSAKILQTLS